MVFSLVDREMVLNLFKIMNSLRIILILPFSKHESSKTRLLNQRLNILVINWKTYLCRS